MDNNSNNPSAGSGQNNNFFSGFLLGLLVGAAVVFLLGTKKGKKLLKVISEDGVDNISNLLKEANKTPSFVKTTEGQRKNFTSKLEIATVEKPIEERPKARRFFRGISRRVN
mgnify:FL=1